MLTAMPVVSSVVFYKSSEAVPKISERWLSVILWDKNRYWNDNREEHRPWYFRRLTSKRKHTWIHIAFAVELVTSVNNILK